MAMIIATRVESTVIAVDEAQSVRSDELLRSRYYRLRL